MGQRIEDLNGPRELRFHVRGGEELLHDPLGDSSSGSNANM